MTLLARWAYTLLLTLLSPLYALRLLWRARVEPLYAHALGERFGFYAKTHDQGGWVWIHAVSLGETRAAAALIHALRAQKPGMRLLLTHGTATGRSAGQALLGEGDAQVWLPYDTDGAVRRFLKHFRPQVGVLMETEVWPQLLHQAQQLHIPMLLANGRLSERSLRRGERWRSLLRPAAQSLRLVMAQTQSDAERFKQAGVREVIACGNLKFDMQPDEVQLAQGRVWRAAAGRPVVLAASTREGEEGPLLTAWKKQTAALPAPPLLVMVPRHPQRFDEVAQLVESAGCSSARRSLLSTTPDAELRTVDVLLGDSMGEMAMYYGIAHVALLGGSFAPLGGQNLIEAAACGCPVVMGPHTFNFTQAADLALQAGVAWRVVDMDAAISKALSLMNTAALTQAAELTSGFALRHQGAAQTMAQRVVAVMATR
ncbi:MAG: 3-deoxy-D-manno-octulosonic acid transferase [Burkholderiaceae bacterium]